MQRILQISILQALILASLCRVHANIHPLAFALWVALITQCELRTCASPPAVGICVPTAKARGLRGAGAAGRLLTAGDVSLQSSGLTAACWSQLHGSKGKRAL